MALQYPKDISRLPGIVRFTVKNANNTSLGTVIELPLPASLAFADKANYENADLGAVGGALYDGRITEEQAEEMSQTAEEGGKSVADLMLDVAIKVPSNTARGAIGRTPNPNTRALFKSVGLRGYSFQFSMFPTDTREGDTIEEIVKAFRKELYPESTGGVGIFGSTPLELAYKFPNRFKIEMFVGDARNGRFEVPPKIRECYLTSVETQLPNTRQVLNDGGDYPQFANTVMTLTFLESQTLYSKDVAKGY